MATASTGKGAGASAVLGGTVPYFPSGLARLHRGMKTERGIYLHLPSEQLKSSCVCLIVHESELSALPRAPPPLKQGVFRLLNVSLIEVLTALWSQLWSNKLIQSPL